MKRANARWPGVSHSKLGKNQPTDGDLPVG
jgi:hypothetical protein